MNFRLLLYIVLGLSLIGNVKLFYNHFRYSKKIVSKQLPHYQNRQNVFKVLPLDSNSIILLGDSHFQNFEIAEFFSNPHLKNRGINSDRADQLIDRLDEIIEAQPKKVFIEIGINDLVQGKSADSTFNDIKDVVRHIQNKSPGTIVYLHELFPCNWLNLKSRKSIVPSVLLLNQQLESFSNAQSIALVKVYEDFNLNDRLNIAYDCGDSLHLNGIGYLRWKEIIEPYFSN